MAGPSGDPAAPTHLTRQGAIWGAVLAALSLCLGLATPRAMTRFAHPRTAKRAAAQAEGVMLRRANAYRSPAAALGLPAFSVQHVPSTSGGAARIRTVWTGYVDAGGQQVVLLMNDTTGNLIGAFNQGVPRHAGPKLPAAPVDTAEQAVTLSMVTARALGLIPDGAQVALAGVPVMPPHNSTWRVEWKVRTSAGDAPYQVDVALQRETGRLVSAVNFREVNQFADR